MGVSGEREWCCQSFEGSEKFCLWEPERSRSVPTTTLEMLGHNATWTTSSWAMHRFKFLAASSTNFMWFGTKHILSSSLTWLWRQTMVPQMTKLGPGGLSWATLSWPHRVLPRRAHCSAVCDRAVLLRLILFSWREKKHKYRSEGKIEGLEVEMYKLRRGVILKLDFFF